MAAYQWINFADESKVYGQAYTWLRFGVLKLEAGTQIDGLAVMMLIVVGVISTLVHIYSTEYLKGDIRYTHYYAALSLFTASMMMLIVAAWISAETGVGPAIASGSQVCRGNCPDLPMIPSNRARAVISINV